MKAHFEMMAAYNAWANRRLLAACAALDEADFRADLGAFFRSLHGTVNHLVVADRIWMARFRGAPAPAIALDAILYEARDALFTARQELDAEITRYIGGLTEIDLAGDITYRMVTRDETVTQARAPALAHFFNHQTHHRGQAHALLTRLSGEAPSFDLVQFQRGAA